MASGWTNKGKYAILGQYFRAETKPTNLYLALVTSAAAPDADTNTFTELTEVGTGTGYTAGGTSLSFNSTDFDVWTENDTSDYAFVQIKDITWTASGGSLPNGNSARWAVLTDDNGTPANREIYAWWDLVSDRQVSDGQDLTLQDCELRLT